MIWKLSSKSLVCVDFTSMDNPTVEFLLLNISNEKPNGKAEVSVLFVIYSVYSVGTHTSYQRML